MWGLNNNLRPGDIILIRGGGKKSHAIATLTRDVRAADKPPLFSHAMIATSFGSLIEAMPSGGVQLISGSRVVVNDRRNIATLRLRETDDHESADIAKAAAELAHMYLGHNYDPLPATMSAFRGMKGYKEYIFCSSLVALVFEQVKSPLFRGVVRHHQVTPNRLFRSPALESIDQIVLSFAESTAPAELALDGQPGPRANSLQFVEWNRIVARANLEFKRAGFRIATGVSDVQLILVEKLGHPEISGIDAVIAREIEQSNLKNIAVLGRMPVVVPDIDQVRNAVFSELDFNKLIREIESRLDKQLSLIEDLERDRETYRIAFEKTGLLTFGELFAVQSSVCKYSLNSFQVEQQRLYLLQKSGLR